MMAMWLPVCTAKYVSVTVLPCGEACIDIYIHCSDVCICTVKLRTGDVHVYTAIYILCTHAFVQVTYYVYHYSDACCLLLIIVILRARHNIISPPWRDGLHDKINSH